LGPGIFQKISCPVYRSVLISVIREKEKIVAILRPNRLTKTERKAITISHLKTGMVSDYMSQSNVNGLVRVKSQHSFVDTLSRLESTVQGKGLTIFARIHFSDDAEKAGLKMDPSALVIFGNPRAGTPLMQAAPTLAIDFPLKILVSQDKNGTVWVSYNTPDYLRERHNIPADLIKNIAGIAQIADTVAK
jgi:uncharacterized protein (DUF302 family)